MACSKLFSEEPIDVKIVYDYYGKSRCALLDIKPSVLYTHNLSDFTEFVLDEVPYLRRLIAHRICFLDEENMYVDVTDKNFSKFVKSVMSRSSKITVNILDGTSPSVARQQQLDDNDTTSNSGFARKSLKYEQCYSSPAELDIKSKEGEVNEKTAELHSLSTRYDEIAREMNADVWRDKSKRACHNCHMRIGHDRKKCNMSACESVAICGEIDLHPDAKKHLAHVSQEKQKVAGELKAMANELDAKKKAHKETFRTFEGQTQSWLIRSNPDKYLIPATGQVRQVRVNADTAILRKHYNGVVPSAIETVSKTWPNIIENVERKSALTPVRSVKGLNPVRTELESRGIVWPDTGKKGTETLYPSTPAQESEQVKMAMSMSLLNTPPFVGTPNFGQFYYPFPMPSQQYPMSPLLYPGYQSFAPIGATCRKTTATVTSDTSEVASPPLPPIPRDESPKPPPPEN
jgi:hypothetical protein